MAQHDAAVAAGAERKDQAGLVPLPQAGSARDAAGAAHVVTGTGHPRAVERSAREAGAIAILTTHDTAAIEHLTDAAVTLVDGRLAA